MNQTEKRDILLGSALIAPDATSHGLRHFSAGSLILLQLVNNPLYDISTDAVAELEHNPYRLAEFCWIHSAPLQEVKKLCMGARLDPEAVQGAVLDWAGRHTVPELMAMLPDIYSEAESVSAAMAATIPDGNCSKNVCGPTTSQASVAARQGLAD